MKNEYLGYTKKINGELFFFVKAVIIIEKVEDSPITVGFGMQTQFEKACAIAGIHDTDTINRIYKEIQQQEPLPAIIIDFNDPKFKSGKKIS